MRIGPLEIRYVKQAPLAAAVVSDRRGGWWPIVREPYTGAWQRNDEWTVDTVLAFHAVYACVTLIANDIGKLRPKLVELDADGIWTEVSSPAFSRVLRRPNDYQNHIQFKQWWTTCKLLRGNAYALKERDGRGGPSSERGNVRRLHLLDPNRVSTLVAPDGSVWYELKADNLAALEQQVVVPASEIIHDRINCLFHPLIGTTPIFAAGTAADTGLHIERNSGKFFANGSKVSGQLLVPTAIPQEKADEFRERWQQKFSGDNAGQIAVLSGGMKFEPLQMTSVDAQLVEQLQWSATSVCSAFHVPPYKVHIGEQPAYTSPELSNSMYYSDCLQSHIEQFELCMDDGLGIGEGSPKEGRTYGVELDLDGLIRMDAQAQIAALTTATGGAVMAVNEARKRLSLKPKAGGDEIWMQQQNYSLPALAERDRNDPFAPKPAPAQLPPGDADEEVERAFFSRAFETLEKEMATA